MRLLVLREIGREADAPRWSPEALRARFSYLDPVKLETVLKRLRDNALLAIGEDAHYALSDTGRNAVAAIAMLLHFGEEEDAELGFLTAQLAGLQAVGGITAESLGHLLSKLNDLTWHFEEAIASGSEFRILDARRRLSANGRWLERGTDILNKLLADPEVDFDIARIAQRIGLAQSRLARVDAAFQRALNKIESQRVTLGASGISSSDVAAWLRSLDAGTLAGLALEAFATVPELPLLAGGHELLDRAEALLEGGGGAIAADVALPPSDAAGNEITLHAEDLRMLEHFTRRLGALAAAQPLHQVVAGGGFAPASYRLSPPRPARRRRKRRRRGQRAQQPRRRPGRQLHAAGAGRGVRRHADTGRRGRNCRDDARRGPSAHARPGRSLTPGIAHGTRTQDPHRAPARPALARAQRPPGAARAGGRDLPPRARPAARRRRPAPARQPLRRPCRRRAATRARRAGVRRRARVRRQQPRPRPRRDRAAGDHLGADRAAQARAPGHPPRNSSTTARPTSSAATSRWRMAKRYRARSPRPR
jgi:hypothetical protein